MYYPNPPGVGRRRGRSNRRPASGAPNQPNPGGPQPNPGLTFHSAPRSSSSAPGPARSPGFTAYPNMYFNPDAPTAFSGSIEDLTRNPGHTAYASLYQAPQPPPHNPQLTSAAAPEESCTFKASTMPPASSSASRDPKIPGPGQHPSVPRSKIGALFAEAKIWPYIDTTLPNTRAVSTLENSIRDISWSPLGNLCATADPRVLRVWNPERVAQATRYSIELKPQVSSSRHGSQHLTGTARVAFCPVREAELASLGQDGTLRFWDVRNRAQCVGSLDTGGEGTSLAWNPLNDTGMEMVVGRGNDTLVFVEKRTMGILREIKLPCHMNSFSFCNSGRQFMVPSNDGAVHLFKTEDMHLLHRMRAHTSQATVAIQSPRGQYIATGGADAVVTLWDVDHFYQTKGLTEMASTVRSLSFSHDGAYLVAGGTRPTESAEGKRGIQIWDVERGDVVHTIQTTLAVPTVKFHPGHYLLAFADTAGLKIMHAPLGKE